MVYSKQKLVAKISKKHKMNLVWNNWKITSTFVAATCLMLTINPFCCHGNTGRANNKEHHKAFLGKLKDEYDHLSVEESVRRLR